MRVPAHISYCFWTLTWLTHHWCISHRWTDFRTALVIRWWQLKLWLKLWSWISIWRRPVPFLLKRSLHEACLYTKSEWQLGWIRDWIQSVHYLANTLGNCRKDAADACLYADSVLRIVFFNVQFLWQLLSVSDISRRQSSTHVMFLPHISLSSHCQVCDNLRHWLCNVFTQRCQRSTVNATEHFCWRYFHLTAFAYCILILFQLRELSSQ